jgi:uncharacterized protein YcbK (DUF882 family)
MTDITRRKFMQLGLCAATALSLPRFALASAPAQGLLLAPARELSFYNNHTGEKLRLAYCENNQYVPSALQALNQFMRDFRTGDVHPIDPALFDQLHTLQRVTGNTGQFHIISGYRSPATNKALQGHSDGVAKHSLHMEGKAMDISLPGIELSKLHKAALGLNAGGVGYYPSSDFVHIDTGRLRHWG